MDLHTLSRARHLLATRGVVKTLREAARLTQEEVGNALGVAPSTVANWEACYRLPAGDMPIRLIELLRDAATAAGVVDVQEYLDGVIPDSYRVAIAMERSGLSYNDEDTTSESNRVRQLILKRDRDAEKEESDYRASTGR